MKRLVLIGFVGLMVAICMVFMLRGTDSPVAAGSPAAVAPPAGSLTVHEWGTFTGFAGSDGVHLPFNTLIGGDLPDFVMNRLKQARRNNPKLMDPLLFVKGGGAAALQRMETPVIYFYGDAPAEVNVRVDFPQGMLTEFYPAVKEMGPRYGLALGEFSPTDPNAPPTPGVAPQTQPTAGNQGAQSFLDWGRVRIVPHPAGDEGKHIPAMTNANHYRFARDTDSALVQTDEPGGARDEEKFLFYRGLGDFTLPVTLAALGGDRFALKNASSSPIHAAFLVQIDPNPAKPARFAQFANLSTNQVLTLPAAAAATGDLAQAITRALTADGLYEKEARAMVETWKASWLNEPGTRLLYLLPREATDAMLPLRITPTPGKMVRVFVGRIDVLTPEEESRLASMMALANAGANLSDDDARLLNTLGRFQSPAIGRMSKLAGNAGPQQVTRLWQALARWNAGRH